MVPSIAPTESPAIALLRRSLARGRLGHAYLITGESIEGLETVAREAAMLVNCTAAQTGLTPTPRPCRTCDSCQRTLRGGHPDVSWHRPESKSRIITIDQIRELIQSVNLKPNGAGLKVAVLSAVDRLNPQAANAFLKTLEEPPAQSLLLLLTTDAERLLDTILSRCLRLHGGGAFQADVAHVDWVKEFAGRMASSGTSLLFRYQLLGGLLQRLSALREEVETRIQSAGPATTDMEPKARERLEDEQSAAIEAEYRRQRMDLLGVMLRWFRDVWLLTQVADPELLTLPDLAEQSRHVAQRITTSKALSNYEQIEKTIRLLHTNVQESLALEVGLLSLEV